jgi:putative transposase
LCGFTDRRDFQGAHYQWVKQALGNGLASRDDRWSESIAVGSLAFVERVKNDLGIKAMHREVIRADETYALHEPSEAYERNFPGENEALRSENTLPWEKASKTQVHSLVRPAKRVPRQIKP